MLALSRTATETVIQYKKVIWWEPKPRYTASGETDFLLPERCAGGVHSNIWFHRHFWTRKTSPETA